ncbi:MAG: aspartate:alanine exchanger family transporter [Flavobacteriaceae bacterium]
MDLLSKSYVVLFVIIVIGFLIGRIKIFGISLDVSAVIFVALLFGHYGYIVPKDFQYLGLVLFIFTIGMQAGPSFFASFKKQGRKLAFLASILILSAGLITFLAYEFGDVDRNLAIGLLNGSLTSTPGLAAAIDATKSPQASIGYGIGYPFGVIGVILFVSLLPKFLKIDLDKAQDAHNAEEIGDQSPMLRKFYQVDNENVIGKSLGELNIRFMTKAVVSRVKKGNDVLAPNPDLVLEKGDIIRAVGNEESLHRIELLIGPQSKESFRLNKDYEVRSVLVTNSEVINKSLGMLTVLKEYNATVTRVMRSGISIPPSPSLKLQMGDKIMVVCSRDYSSKVSKVFGDDNRKLSNTDFFPIALGIIIGILVSKISIVVGDFRFSLGLTGGVLIVALILGRLGKTGPIVWTMTGHANQLLRQLGLLFFLAAVGTSAGEHLVDTFQDSGLKLFGLGILITMLPMLLTFVIAKVFYKMNILTFLGTLTGAMTSTPGLAAVDNMVDSDAPAVAYATVYPIAMVLLIVVVQILSLL